MSDLLNIEINGRPLQVKPGTMVIEAADEAGIVIPRFCYHKKLSIAANCRMCLVEMEKAPKPVPACATPVTEGMKVFTKSHKAIEAQKSVMEFLLINHPLDCPICDQGGECDLQDLAMGFGKDASRYHERKRVVREKNIGPLIATDMTRCIHCTRCVRFGREIAGIMELGAPGRGEHMAIETYMLSAVGSEMSGNVIDLCPVGALTSKPYRYSGRPWENSAADSIAPHDCAGSNIYVETRRDKVMRVLPRENEMINEIWLSDRDRFSYAGLYSDDRLQRPQIKQGDVWRDTDWETALGYAVDGLQRVIKLHGVQQTGALASASSTVEELYLLQKLLRGLGSNNIDHRTQQSDFSDQDIAPAYPGLGLPIADLEKLNAALLIGSYTRKDQPIIAHRLRKAAKRGAKISLINSVDYDFNMPITQRVVVAPNEITLQLVGIVKALLEKTGKAAPAAVSTLIQNASVNDTHRAIAEQLSTAERACVLIGTQAMLQANFSTIRALANVVAELANCNLGYLPPGGNAAGAWLAGVIPHRGPAGTNCATGKHAQQMLQDGIKGLVLLNIEPELDCVNPAVANQTVHDADFVIVLTPFVTPNMRSYADVLLPIAPFTETSGTYISAEGRWQSFSASVKSFAEARPAWKVLRVMGNFLELDGFAYVSSEEVRDELDALTEPLQFTTRSEVRTGINTTANGTLQRIGYLPMYAVDSLVRRSIPLQQTDDAVNAMVAINQKTASKLGVVGKERVRVTQQAHSVSLPIYIVEAIPDDCALIPAGVAGTSALGMNYGTVEIQAE